MEKKSFENWTFEEVEDVFGLERQHDIPLMQAWLAAQHEPDSVRTVILEELRLYLREYADAWQEDELKMCFISPLIGLVHYMNPQYKVFTQRNLYAAFPDLNWEVNGRIEWLISKGKIVPKQPFFCLHEYKQENRRDNDPLGQLLVAMVAARTFNKIYIPIYGCYVVGRLWFFVILDENKYSVSLAYDATKTDELKEIFAILTELKGIIEKNLVLANSL